ncbi:hypothetical protein ACOHYD_02545 [Desulfobacterota bacterium M19]
MKHTPQGDFFDRRDNGGAGQVDSYQLSIDKEPAIVSGCMQALLVKVVLLFIVMGDGAVKRPNYCVVVVRYAAYMAEALPDHHAWYIDFLLSHLLVSDGLLVS